MKRCFAVMLTAVFLIAVLASPALAAETYVIEFSENVPSSFSIDIVPVEEGGYALLDYVIPEGLYTYDYFFVDKFFEAVGSDYLSVSYSDFEFDDENVDTEGLFVSSSSIPVSCLILGSSCEVYADVFFLTDLSNFTVVGMSFYSDGMSIEFMSDGAILTLTPVSEYDVVSSLFGSAFNMMISNPLTTTLTAAGLVGVGVTVYTKVKKTARR